MNKYLNLFLWYFSIFVFSLVGCDSENVDESYDVRAKDSEAKKPYFTVTDTGLWAKYTNNFVWIDDQTLIFEGFKTGKYVHYDPKDTNKPPIVPMVWEQENNQFYPLFEEEGHLEVKCQLADGRIYFSAGRVTDPSYKTWLGKLINVDGKYVGKKLEEYKADKERWIPAIDGECFENNKSIYETKRGDTKYLKKIDGELQYYPYTDRTRFVTKANPEGVWLPTGGLKRTRYSSFLESYFYISKLDIQPEPTTEHFRGSYRRSSNDLFFFLLKKDGSFSKKNITDIYSKTSFSRNSINPVKGGYVLRASGLEQDIYEKINNKGLYFVVENSRLQLISLGWFGSIKVSPSGCKVATAHFAKSGQRGWTKDNRITLKIINFCK